MNALRFDVQPVVNRTPRRRRRQLWAALLVAGFALGLGALVASSAARLDGEARAHPDRITYVDPQGNLFTIAPDGSGLRTYPVADARFEFPAWSPDGSRVAAIGGHGSEGAIYVFDDSPPAAWSAAVPPIVVYQPSPQYPIYLYWSPDGRRISFLTSEPAELALQVVAADGSGAPRIVRQDEPMYWDWVDDDHLLVHSGGDAEDAFLGELDLDRPDMTPVAAAPGRFQAPGVSADGRARAYVASPGSDGARVVVEERDGSSHVETPVAGASALAWSPTGDQVAFIAPAPAMGLPLGALRVLDGASGSAQTLLDGLVVAYFWAPDGRTIAAIDLAPSGDLSATTTPVAAGLSLRLRLVDVGRAAVVLTRQIRLTDLVAVRFLPFFDQYALSHRLWSPDGDALVLPLVDADGRSRITIVPADGSEPVPIADGVAAFWSP